MILDRYTEGLKERFSGANPLAASSLRHVGNCITLSLKLAADPGKGVLIPGTGGVRKLRWAASGRGKSGGARVIYYWAKSREVVLMLAAYTKNDQVNLTPAQSKLLRNPVEREFG